MNASNPTGVFLVNDGHEQGETRHDVAAFRGRLEGFSPAEEEMIHVAVAALESEGYDSSLIQALVRVDMPPGYRGMTLIDGAALGQEAFSSQPMLNHVLEEELLHLQQKARGEAELFAPGTARSLEEQVDRSQGANRAARSGQRRQTGRPALPAVPRRERFGLVHAPYRQRLLVLVLLRSV